MTENEITSQYAALQDAAVEWGVTTNTLAQYVDCAGSYSSLTNRDSGVPRRLPPRTSIDGIILASKVTQAIGTDKARSVTVRYSKLLRNRGTDDRSNGGLSSNSTD